MTTKNIKIVLFASLMVAMILPFSNMNFADAATNENANEYALEDATPEEIEEYNIVAPLMNELRQLDIEGKELYKNNKGKLTVDNKSALEQAHERIQVIKAKLGKMSADYRQLYAMDKVTEAKFDSAKAEFVRSGIEFSMVGTDTKNVILEITLPEKYAGEETELIEQIEKIVNVPFSVEFADFQDTACASQEDDCNPIVGGIEINDNCSIALPVVRNVYWWTEDGFLTAAHCTYLWQTIYQPNSGYSSDGITTATVNGGLCDCAFVDETGSASLNSAVWWSSTSSTSITSKSDPLVGDYVYIVGKTTGIHIGKVLSVTYTGGSPTIDDLIQIDWFAVQGGDSGGAIISAFPSATFHGIIKGFLSGDTFASKWSDVDQALDLQ